MNPLQEYPELFANGKFRVRWFFKDEPYDDYLIEGYTLDEGGALMIEGTDGSKHNYIFPKSEKMKLIARPIEDMTDEEWKKWNRIHHISGIDLFEEGINFSGSGRVTHNEIFKIIEYPLSIGVYPFDQQAFETGEVIDTREL